MATSSTNSTDTAVLAGQTIQYSEPVMGPSLCASRHDRSDRRNPPHNSLPLREYVSVFLTKITAVARFWYPEDEQVGDRKSTRLNSSHLVISYAVFCLKKKTQAQQPRTLR